MSEKLSSCYGGGGGVRESGDTVVRYCTRVMLENVPGI